MKEFIDYEMYQDLIKDYQLDLCGGIQLIRICLDRVLGKEEFEDEEKVNDKFIEYYKISTNYEKKSKKNSNRML